MAFIVMSINIAGLIIFEAKLFVPGVAKYGK